MLLVYITLPEQGSVCFKFHSKEFIYDYIRIEMFT